MMVLVSIAPTPPALSSPNKRSSTMLINGIQSNIIKTKVHHPMTINIFSWIKDRWLKKLIPKYL